MSNISIIGLMERRDSMFRKNKTHEQERLFSHFNDLDERLKKRLLKTWAPIFYEHVFCNIDEAPFAALYSDDNGRPNFPINILLSLEFIKHWKDLTDEELLEQASFNYQVTYAIGLRDLGEEYIARRTLYHFRQRVYHHMQEHGEHGDLIFDQFNKLTKQFAELAGIKTNEQRMDSTLISPNIQKMGRLALAFDVLLHAVQSSDEEQLPESLKAVLEPEFKTNLLYRTRASSTQSRLENALELGQQLLQWVQENNLELSEPQRLLSRFLCEQRTWNEAEGKWIVKGNDQIGSDSLQSAHDPDATYRKKGHHAHSGYVCNLAETCSSDNSAQIITDYTLARNIVSDVEMIKDRMPQIKERTDLEDFYVDGGYYGETVEEVAQSDHVKMHYSALTGKKPTVGKMSFAEFEIENRQKICSCPEKQEPCRATFDDKSKTLSAHFDITQCRECPRLNECPVKLQKKEAVIRVSQKRVLADETRQLLMFGGQKEITSKRAAIEGTNSALKRRQGMNKLRVRGLHKSRVVVGIKIVAHNFQQLLHGLKRLAQKAAEGINRLGVPILQGVSLQN